MSTTAAPSRGRRIARGVLIAVAVFALALSGLLAFWAPSHAIKTPLNLKISLVYRGSGTIFDTGTGKLVQKQFVATQRLASDSKASDGTNVVISEYQCVAVDVNNPPACPKVNDPRFVTAQTDRVAMNRRTGESVNNAKYKETVGGAPATHQGLTYRWPFDSKKQTYSYFDTTLQTAVPATYTGSQKVNGVTAYVYVATTPTEKLDVIKGVPGTFQETNTILVEPQTGTIVSASTHQVRKFANGDPALDITLTMDDKSTTSQVSKANDGIDQIRLLTVIAPIVLLAVGVLAAIGALLLFRGKPEAGTPAQPPFLGTFFVDEAKAPQPTPQSSTPESSSGMTSLPKS